MSGMLSVENVGSAYFVTVEFNDNSTPSQHLLHLLYECMWHRFKCQRVLGDNSRWMSPNCYKEKNNVEYVNQTFLYWLSMVLGRKILVILYSKIC